ncbi:MAG: N-acetylglucosamine-6-phosphate deacetylase [Opitutaceae bacterium]|jgi:N-acetylglucosamine-6-phosphate deacetylase|nr:N-acetylglucosamine-6-phosphate deacetylase [Opitutaceae bacterium]
MSASAPFLDLQVNGYAGVDFQQNGLTPAALEHAMQALLAHGTGRILLTLITDSIDAMCARLEYIERLRRRSELARRIIAGYHLEGPWLLPEPGYHGAHNPALMKAPKLADFCRLHEASGEQIRLVTLAPEWPGSPGFIAHITGKRIRTAIGHSNASDDEIDAAIAAGLTLCTHLGNGVPAQLHRHDNIIQRLLARDELTAVFIPDGIHIPAPVLRNFVRAKPPGKALFTTDCMAAAAAAAGPGRYTLGRIVTEVGLDGVVREPGKENFAGSALTMDHAANNVQAFLGWNREQAFAACSTGVATALGL